MSAPAGSHSHIASSAWSHAHLLAPTHTSGSSAQPGMNMYAPSRTSYSSAQPGMHPHAPSRTPVSSAHAMCAHAGSLSYPCQLCTATYAPACFLLHCQLRTAMYAPACSLSHHGQLRLA
eukprot:4488352-Pyramimonas_sp.AAC.1